MRNSSPKALRRLNIARIIMFWMCMLLLASIWGKRLFVRLSDGREGIGALWADVLRILPVFGDIVLSLALLVLLFKTVVAIPAGPDRQRLRRWAIGALVVVMAWWAGLRLILLGLALDG